MDKRKLIGTIIGVTMFAALIAGATFAWLSFTANVTNSAFNAKTRNFIITYNGGTTVDYMLQTKTPTTTVLDAAQNEGKHGKTTVTASKSNKAAPTDSFKLKLTISTNTLSTKSIVYAVCKGTCPNSINLATVSGSGSSTSAACGTGVLSCGTVYGTNEVVLHTDSTTFNTLDAASASYDIYFWLNPATMTNADINKRFVGKISAEATQNEV